MLKLGVGIATSTTMYLHPNKWRLQRSNSEGGRKQHALYFLCLESFFKIRRAASLESRMKNKDLKEYGTLTVQRLFLVF